MDRRSGYKVYTKVTQYFTDNNSTVNPSYVQTFSGSNITACGVTFTSGTLLTSSLSCGRFTECLYGSDGNAGSNSNYYFFASGSTTGSSCVESNNFKGYVDTPSIVVGPSGSRLYVSGTLCPADQKYYSLSGSWYQVGDVYGTITASGSCEITPPSSSYTSIGTADLVSAMSCNVIGTSPEIFLNSTDYTKYINNGGCLANGSGTNTVSVIRDSNGNPLTGTFYFVWYGSGCNWTTFKSTFGNLTTNQNQC